MDDVLDHSAAETELLSTSPPRGSGGGLKLGEVSEAQKAAEREAAATKAVLDRKTQQVAETRRLLFSSEARHIGSEAPRAQKMRF